MSDGKPTYPGYDVLRKYESVSWDDVTRQVIDARMAVADEPAYCNETQWACLRALCESILPQTGASERVPLAALVDRKIGADGSDGYRPVGMLKLQAAWQAGLQALNDESERRHAAVFAEISEEKRVALLEAMQHGHVTGSLWSRIAAQEFFKQRVLPDICSTYYAHPFAWNEIGFGGPANPRGYVRMNANRRDPWEAIAAGPGQEDITRRRNQNVK